MGHARPTHIPLEADRQRALAGELFNYVWTLIETEERSERETELMVAAAYASRLFWEETGEPFRLARGEWQISRAAAIAGRPVEALEHGELCLRLCEAHQLDPFDFGYAYEALARAQQLAANHESAAEYIDKARAVAARITDPEERALLDSDLDAIPT